MTTYYVSDATGDDGDDGLSEGNATATIQAALDLTTHGDQVWIKNDGEYAENATCDYAVSVSGYSSTIGDGGMAVIDATGGSGLIFNVDYSSETWHVQNLEIKDGSGDGLSINRTAAGFNQIIFCERVYVHDMVGSGIISNYASCTLILKNCVSMGNGSYGVYQDNGNQNFSLLGCYLLNNTNEGVYADNGEGTAVYCVIAGNGGNGANIGCLIHCTIDDNTDGAISHNNGGLVVGCILSNNSAWGFDPENGDGEEAEVIISGTYGYNNTSGFYDGTLKYGDGNDETGADPDYADAANFDFTLGASSDARGMSISIGNPDITGGAGDVLSDTIEINAGAIQDIPSGGSGIVRRLAQNLGSS